MKYIPPTSLSELASSPAAGASKACWSDEPDISEPEFESRFDRRGIDASMLSSARPCSSAFRPAAFSEAITAAMVLGANAAAFAAAADADAGANDRSDPTSRWHCTAT